MSDCKIAFLFLTYNDLKQYTLWENYFKQAKNYNIYVHPKFPTQVTNPLLIKRIIPNIIETKWGDISLVEATINLLEEALNDSKENNKFILLSDSCIPVSTFDDMYKFVTKNDNSYLTAVSNHKSRYNKLKNKSYISKKEFRKQHQWMMLNRRHAQLIVDTRQNTRFFSDMFAPDEHYFVNTLKHYNQSFINHCITYVDWVDQIYHPRIFKLVDVSLAEQLQKNNYFFLRKIEKDTKVDHSIVVKVESNNVTPIIICILVLILIIYINRKTNYK